jgi:hypothetical protein
MRKGKGKEGEGKGRERGGEEREGKGYCVAKTQIIWLSNLLMLSYLMNVIPETFMCTKFDIYVFITSFPLLSSLCPYVGVDPYSGYQ